MDRLRSYCNRICDKDYRTARDVFRVLLHDAGDSIQEDAYVRAMLSTNISVLPDEFTKLFQFIDNDEDGYITLDQHLAVLNLDEVSSINAALQEKLRDRSRDLESRQLSPLRMFQDADSWGGKGIVTRLEFKGVLKRMGFNLADEPEPFGQQATAASSMGSARMQLLERAAGIKAAGGAAAFGAFGGKVRGGRDREEDEEKGDRDLLNDTMDSGVSDEILGEAEAPHPGGAKARQEAHKQKQIFEQRQEELRGMKQRKRDTAAADSDGEPHKSVARDLDFAAAAAPAPVTATATAIGKNLLDDSTSGAELDDLQHIHQAQPMYKSAEHNLGIVAHPVVVLDDRHRDAAGEADGPPGKPPTRAGKVATAASASQGGIAEAAPAASKSAPAESGIITAENAIRSSIAALEGAQPVPNVLGGFQTVDTRNTGFVSKPQFAHVMKQFEMIQLYGADLKACMEFFDASGEGNQIDYNAFVRFVR